MIQEAGLHQTESACALMLDSSHQNCKNKFLLFTSYPFYSFYCSLS